MSFKFVNFRAFKFTSFLSYSKCRYKLLKQSFNTIPKGLKTVFRLSIANKQTY